MADKTVCLLAVIIIYQTITTNKYLTTNYILTLKLLVMIFKFNLTINTKQILRLN